MVGFNNVIEQLQMDYLDKYKGVQAEIHQVSQFDVSSAVSIIYLGKVEMSREDVLKAKDQFHLQISLQI